MGLKGPREPKDEHSDVESEREALRRQRVEAANELASLKQTLSERVSQVQQRERELADALASLLIGEGELQAAEPLVERSLALRLTRQGEDNNGVATARQRLASRHPTPR